MRFFSKQRNASLPTLKQAVAQKSATLPAEQQRLVAAYALGLRDGLLLHAQTTASLTEEPPPPEEPLPLAPTEFRKG